MPPAWQWSSPGTGTSGIDRDRLVPYLQFQHLGQLGELPEVVLADARYVNAEAFDLPEQAGVELYCNERRYDFRTQSASGRALMELSNESLMAMRTSYSPRIERLCIEGATTPLSQFLGSPRQ